MSDFLDITKTPVTISEAESAENSRTRLMRKLRSVSREVRKAERTLLEAICARGAGRRANQPTPSNLFNGMHARTLTPLEVHRVDCTGYAHYKVDGIAAQAAWVSMSRHTAGQPDEPLPYISNKATNTIDQKQTLFGRADTVIFILRNGQTFAVDCVPLPLAKNGRTLIDGELCLRTKKLSDTEQRRFEDWKKSDEFCNNYLDPDSGDADDDTNYELCFAAHDIIVADTHVQSNAKNALRQPPIAAQPYEKRLVRLHERINCRPDDPNTQKLMRTIATDLIAAGVTRLPVRVFAKRPFPMHLVSHMVRVMPSALVGMRTDGLVLVGNNAPFAQGTSDTLLRVKWQHTADMRVRVSDDGHSYEFYVSDRDEPIPSAGIHFATDESDANANHMMSALMRVTQANLEADDAAFFVESTAERTAPAVMEFAPYVSDEAREFFKTLPVSDAHDLFEIAAPHIAWTPIMIRSQRRSANMSATVHGVLEATVWPFTVVDLADHVRTTVSIAQSGMAEAEVATETAMTMATD